MITWRKVVGLVGASLLAYAVGSLILVGREIVDIVANLGPRKDPLPIGKSSKT